MEGRQGTVANQADVFPDSKPSAKITGPASLSVAELLPGSGCTQDERIA